MLIHFVINIFILEKNLNKSQHRVIAHKLFIKKVKNNHLFLNLLDLFIKADNLICFLLLLYLRFLNI